MDNDNACPERDNLGEVCGGEIPPGSPVDLCKAHLIKAYLFMQGELSSARDRTADPRVLTSHDEREYVIYYLRLGTRVKIGTTRDVQARLASLPHEEILALEPGGFAVERRRHEEFRRLRVRGEWFRADEALLQHAEALRQLHPDLQSPRPVVTSRKAPQLVTTAQAAQLIGVRQGVVRLWAHRGHLRQAAADDGSPLCQGNRPLYWSHDVRATAARLSR